MREVQAFRNHTFFDSIRHQHPHIERRIGKQIIDVEIEGHILIHPDFLREVLIELDLTHEHGSAESAHSEIEDTAESTAGDGVIQSRFGVQIRGTHKGHTSARVCTRSAPHPVFTEAGVHVCIIKVARITDDGKHDGHHRPVICFIHVFIMEIGIVPAVGIAPTAIADELHAVIDGLRDLRSSRELTGIVNRIHLRIAIIEELCAQPSTHPHRSGRAKRTFRIVACNHESTLHPSGINHIWIAFIAHAFAEHICHLHDLGKGKSSHEHLRKIVIPFDEHIGLIIRIHFVIFRRRIAESGDGEIAHGIAHEQQIVGTVFEIIVSNRLPDFVCRAAGIDFIDHLDIEAQGAFPVDEFSLIVRQIRMRDDEHLRTCQGQAAKI